MDKTEFYNYIKSFNKKPGTYTEDEIYKIGVAHKQLLKEEKCWEDVANYIGWSGTGEQLRGRINYLMKKEGVLPTNNKVLSDKTVEDIEDNDLIALKQDLMKQQQKTRDEWTAYRRLIRNDARTEIFIDAIKDTVGQLNSLPKLYYRGSKQELHNEAILMVSDLHIGVECDNFYNKYNTEIAMARVNKLVNETIKYCKLHKVVRLNVCNLGDLVHGLIHTSARVEQELDVTKQVMVAAEILANALNGLQEAAPEIIYRSVIDNHSRAISDKEDSIEAENFGRIIDWFVKERLKDTSIIFGCDNIDLGIGKFDLMNDKKVMFAHGHQDNINTVFQHFVGATREFIDFVLLAHYHSEKMKSFQGFRVVVNGSVVGTEQYALGKRLFGDPSQTLLIFEDDNIINISINLKFTGMDKESSSK